MMAGRQAFPSGIRQMFSGELLNFQWKPLGNYYDVLIETKSGKHALFYWNVLVNKNYLEFYWFGFNTILQSCITYSAISFHELKVQTWLFLLEILHNPQKSRVINPELLPASIFPPKSVNFEVWNHISYMVFNVLLTRHPKFFTHHPNKTPEISWGSSAMIRSASTSDLSLGQSSSTNAWGFRVGLQPSSLRFASGRRRVCGGGLVGFHGILGDRNFPLNFGWFFRGILIIMVFIIPPKQPIDNQGLFLTLLMWDLY